MQIKNLCNREQIILSNALLVNFLLQALEPTTPNFLLMIGKTVTEHLKQTVKNMTA